jgi:hypothetical protein
MLLERIRDYASFIISIVSSYIYFTDGNCKDIADILATYLVVDLFINRKMDIFIHHFLGIFLYSFIHVNQLSEESENIIMKPFIALEISSVFYNIICLYPNNRFSLLNNLLFFSTFFYYRIYKYYYSVLQNDVIQNIIENTKSSKFYYFIIYNFYALNIYWFTKMVKIIIKILRKV